MSLARSRPSRREIDPVAFDLIARRGAEVMATARRWSSTPEDAEDAYQRGLEILLTKAPTTAEDELVPWLKTVVKHEALAVRRQRERAAPVTDDGEPTEPREPAPATHDEAERYERLRVGAEALRRLKPQEVRCLLLRAEGYSYKQIADITGWSYTKVNRCLSEGRRAFFERVAGIEAGSECQRLEPLLSALADGEADADALAELRPHLKTCLTCRARLRDYRAAPTRVAVLVPAGLVVAAGGADTPGALRGLLESVVGATQDNAGALGERAHAAAELATGQKLAAVAASAAALAVGGAGVERLAGDDRGPRGRATVVKAEPVKEQAAPLPEPPAPVPAPAPEPLHDPVEPEPPAPPPPAPADEFTPGPGPAPAATSASPTPPPAAPSGGFVPGGSGGSGSGGGEFGP